MWQFVKLYWSICRLRADPGDVPYSKALLGFVLLLNFLIGWFQFSFKATPLISSLQSLLILTISAGFTYFVLSIKGLLTRFVQTFSALLGTSAIVNLIIFPLLLLQPVFFQKKPVNSMLVSLQFMFLLAVLMINIWLIMIMVHIYSKALDVNYLVGLLVTIALLGLDIIIFSRLFS